MSDSCPASEPKSTSTLPEESGVLVARKHHLLVRWSHWLNLPILLGLIVSGISIYWASPVYQLKPDPNTGSVDVAADIGIWICSHVPGLHHYSSPPDWLYSHMSLGPGMLALALRLHWLCAYSFMLNGMARVWHFWLMWLYILFVVPHVILVFADGWDTLRSMIVGWSTRVKRSEFTANEQ